MNKDSQLNMETIFNHNVTEQELEYLHIKVKNESEYKENLGDYKRLSDLYVLFTMRKDDLKAKEYAEELRHFK